MWVNFAIAPFVRFRSASAVSRGFEGVKVPVPDLSPRLYRRTYVARLNIEAGIVTLSAFAV